jgi:Flp pilus assembly protein protease CpaA
MTLLTAGFLALSMRLALTVSLFALAAYDLRMKCVPNALTRAAVIVGWSVLSARLVLGWATWAQVGVATATSLVCLPLVWAKVFGGGDMKLMIALITLFPDARLVYFVMAAVLLGSMLALITWDGRAGLRRLAALLMTASQGAWPTRSEIAVAYHSRGRPMTFAFSVGAVGYLWLIWPWWG